MKDLDALVATGWFVKLMYDPGAGEWRCWLRWPHGDLPHKEESSRQPNFRSAVSWLKETSVAWRDTN